MRDINLIGHSKQNSVLARSDGRYFDKGQSLGGRVCVCATTKPLRAARSCMQLAVGLLRTANSMVFTRAVS